MTEETGDGEIGEIVGRLQSVMFSTAGLQVGRSVGCLVAQPSCVARKEVVREEKSQPRG